MGLVSLLVSVVVLDLRILGRWHCLGGIRISVGGLGLCVGLDIGGWSWLGTLNFVVRWMALALLT